MRLYLNWVVRNVFVFKLLDIGWYSPTHLSFFSDSPYPVWHLSHCLLVGAHVLQYDSLVQAE